MPTVGKQVMLKGTTFGFLIGELPIRLLSKPGRRGPKFRVDRRRPVMGRFYPHISPRL